MYNLDRAIFGLHHLNGTYSKSDTNAGFAPYLDVLEIAKQRANSRLDAIAELNDILIHQDEKGMCEYCAIGPNDMDMIKKLPPWHKATFRSNIWVTMDVTTNRATWNGLRYHANVPNVVIEQEITTCQIGMSYQELHKIIETANNALESGPEWEYFVSRIKCLPYAQDLIL